MSMFLGILCSMWVLKLTYEDIIRSSIREGEGKKGGRLGPRLEQEGMVLLVILGLGMKPKHDSVFLL